MAGDQAARKLLGAWYTPPELVSIVVDGVLAGFTPPRSRAVRVLDPACGDGRFLTAIADRLAAEHPTARLELTGCDIDPGVLAAITDPRVHGVHADALTHRWDGDGFDIVVGNPPYLSQMAAATTRGGSSRHGGGPYADAAVEFLALAVELARADAGRVGLVLPQSILGARDAAPVRERVAVQADLTWSWWAPRQQHFDAAVNVCALGFVRPATGVTTATSFTGVVTGPLGVPLLPAGLATAGTLGDRADLNANFRDEYYALVPAVSDEAIGPPLVTSGLIDPGRCRWGEQPVTFAKRTFAAPRVDLGKLDGRFPAWAARKLVPKVLVANQTRIIEAVADPDGAWLPGVPVSTVTPLAGDPDVVRTVWEVAAVLTSPVASVHAWHWAAGTGLSTTAVRLGPAVLAAVPWPAGDLRPAVAALRAGDVVGCAEAVCAAHGLGAESTATLLRWWTAPTRAAGRDGRGARRGRGRAGAA
jgi:SAM-dependent methyltransferase